MFNTILNDVKSKVKDYKKVSKALVAFSAKLKSEAMFGNTLLPLYIVYGMGGGAHYKGTRDEFENMTTATLAERGKEMDVPFSDAEQAREWMAQLMGRARCDL